MDEATLIEPSVKNYLFNTLQKCHSKRVDVYFYVLNIGVLLIFGAIVIATLYYCYTQKPNEYDRQQKLIKDQEYVMSKIRFYQEQRKNDEETKFSKRGIELNNVCVLRSIVANDDRNQYRTDTVKYLDTHKYI